MIYLPPKLIGFWKSEQELSMSISSCSQHQIKGKMHITPDSGSMITTHFSGIIYENYGSLLCSAFSEFTFQHECFNLLFTGYCKGKENPYDMRLSINMMIYNEKGKVDQRVDRLELIKVSEKVMSEFPSSHDQFSFSTTKESI
ncbi:MAG: hypothetical protein AAGA64_03225 [Bacteroidota bacterium]